MKDLVLMKRVDNDEKFNVERRTRVESIIKDFKSAGKADELMTSTGLISTKPGHKATGEVNGGDEVRSSVIENYKTFLEDEP